MRQPNPFASPKTCDWCERPAIKSAGTNGAFIPRFHLCALHDAAPQLLAALEGLSKAVVAAVAAEPHILLGKEIDDAQYQALDSIKEAKK